MNLKVILGKEIDGDRIEVNLKKDRLHFILLVGSTGSGKSVFHYHLYKQLAEQNRPIEFGFVFFDMTRIDFASLKSPYILEYIADASLALKRFEELAKKTPQKIVVIHVEEMNMLSVSTQRFEAALKDVLKHENIYVVFSTSRPSVDVLTPNIRKLIDLKVVFSLSSKTDSEFVLGESLAEEFSEPGTRVLIFNDKKIICKPFSEEQVKSNEDFFWK